VRQSEADPTDHPSNKEENGRSTEGGGRPPRGLHPFVRGLLDTLPEPETNWTVEGRAKWLQAAANIFDLMYKGDGKITISASGSNRATE
jgi:hypothetical protein